jgi:hypothetical protein
MTEIAKNATEVCGLLRALADLIEANGMPMPTATIEQPIMPRSQSTLGPLDVPTLYPAHKSADDDVATVHVCKTDDDQQLVFGWASVADIVDSQGDIIEPHELEKAVYQFVRDYSLAGELHVGGPVGKIVESMVLTQEKAAAMGLPAPTSAAWWIGMRVDDPEVFAKVKSGSYRMFSIQGRAMRQAA